MNKVTKHYREQVLDIVGGYYNSKRMILHRDYEYQVKTLGLSGNEIDRTILASESHIRETGELYIQTVTAIREAASQARKRLTKTGENQTKIFNVIDGVEGLIIETIKSNYDNKRNTKLTGEKIELCQAIEKLFRPLEQKQRPIKPGQSIYFI